MAIPRHLPKAPITEAVIDFMIDVAPEKGFSHLEACYRQLDFGYRQQGAVLAGAFQLTTSDTAVGIANVPGADQRVGLRLLSKDDKYVALVRVNGMSVSRLSPYEDFETLSAEMRRLWNIYINRWIPGNIKRVACRFINDLRLPMGHGQSFGNFVKTFIEIPPKLPQNISGFVQQFVMQDPGTQSNVRLSLAWNGQNQGGRIPVIFDIDAFKFVDLEIHDEESWELLGKLRDLKNACFFEALTDECIKLYE
jgi:uncharacterized protein (TIGR04255 family)